MLFDQLYPLNTIAAACASGGVTWVYYHGLCVVQLWLSLHFEQNG